MGRRLFVLVKLGCGRVTAMSGSSGRYSQLGLACGLCLGTYDTGKAKRRSAIDGRTTCHPGYSVSQKKRKRIEELFGWLKTIAGLRQSKFRGLERVGMSFTFALAAYNLIRLPKLLAEVGT